MCVSMSDDARLWLIFTYSSGAGKSTFMNVLMGKSDRTGGRLMINGREAEMHHYKKIVGCVPQDDIMLQELTVRENIEYSARVRLPRSWTHKEIVRFADAVLDTLDLAHVAENLITSVSGGQRKRVNIGMELVTCPSAIFLDEPTSGLDATAALKVANTMKKIASDIGISVVSGICCGMGMSLSILTSPSQSFTNRATRFLTSLMVKQKRRRSILIPIVYLFSCFPRRFDDCARWVHSIPGSPMQRGRLF